MKNRSKKINASSSPMPSSPRSYQHFGLRSWSDIEYGRELEHYRYRIYVDELTYMSFVVPTIVAFWVRANLFRVHTGLDELKMRITLLLERAPLFPSSLRFIFFQLSNVKYIGLNISEGTSMGISIAGEGYANFGWGGLDYQDILAAAD